jgi:NADPH2:quinone reductase
MLQGCTAHFLATSTYPLNDGDTALVLAAAGGVGRLLVQICRRRGARVIAVVGSAEKAELARSAGAGEVIVGSEEDFSREVRSLTGERGVDVVYDSVGNDTFDRSLDSLRPRGMMVLYGQASGPVPPLDPQVLNRKGSLFLTRPTLGHYTGTREELLWRTGELFDWYRKGDLDVRIDTMFPLAQAGDAHRYMEARRSKGKVLLLP